MRPLTGPQKLCPPKVIDYWMRYCLDESVRAAKTKNLIGTKHCSGRAYFKCHFINKKANDMCPSNQFYARFSPIWPKNDRSANMGDFVHIFINLASTTSIGDQGPCCACDMIRLIVCQLIK